MSGEGNSDVRKEQDNDYFMSLIDDLNRENDAIITLMDATVEYIKETESQKRLEYLNQLTPKRRRRLIAGETLESIMGIDDKPAKYYNSNTTANNNNSCFEYRIGNHLMLYHIEDVKIDERSKQIRVPVIVFDKDWIEKSYCITDEDVYEIVCSIRNNIINNAYTRTIATTDNTSKTNPNSYNIVERFESPDPGVLRIQKKLYETLAKKYPQNEDFVTQSVYSVDMCDNIQICLSGGQFPFEVVNTMVERFDLLLS